MKKRIGLISLLAAGFSAVALTSCGGANDVQVKQNQDNISKINKEVKSLEDSLDSSKEALEESIAKINLYLKLEQIAANGDAIASLEKKILQLQETSNANLNAKAEELVNALDGKAGKSELTDAIQAFNNAIDSKASKDALAALGETVDGIISNYATNESVNTLATNLKAELAAKTDLDAIISRITAVEESLQTDYISKTNFDTAIASLVEISTDLQEAIGDVIKDGDNVISLQEQITRLEDAKATVEKLSEIETALNNKTKALQDKIDLIEQEIGEIATSDEDEVISLQSQIDQINEKIGSIMLDDNNEIISLQHQIDDIKEQIGDYSSSNELKNKKADLVLKLSESYATFQDEMKEIELLLTDTYSEYVDNTKIKKLFLDIQKKYNHEMTGNLYKGIALITLARNEQEAIETEAEYEILINNFINPAKFELVKELDKAYIAIVDETIDIDSGYDNLSIREKLTAEVEAVEWFTDEELKDYLITEDDDDATQKEKTVAYKEATQAKIDLMNAAAFKSHIIRNFLSIYNSSRSRINDALSASKYDDAREAFIEILDEEIYDLEAYYNCKNIDIEVIEIDPTTGTEKTKTYVDLVYELLSDVEEIELLLNEVSDYISLNNYVEQELEKVNTGTGKLVYIASKEVDDVTELALFNEEVFDVIDYENYAKLNNTIEKSGIQLEEDKAIVDLYIAKAKAYNELIKYCNDSIDEVSETLDDSTQETAEETTVNALIAAIHEYDNYITADLVIEIPADSQDDTLKSVAEQLEEDKAAADLLVKRAITFKNIFDAINDDSTGLVAYIDNKTTVVNQGDVNLFVTDLKNKFKAEFTDLAVAEKYDVVIKDYTTQKEFTDYEESILKDEGILDLIKKNVDVFANILVIDNNAKNTINGYADLSDNYKTAFIDNFKAYATYETNNTNTKNFTKKEDFDTYYTDTVENKITNIVKVAKYENDLSNKTSSVIDKIIQAYQDDKISEDVSSYLVSVATDIYNANTSVTKTETGLETLQTIASDAYTIVAAKLTAVQNAITTFHNIDVASALLETKLYTYKTTQEKIFLDTNYRYRDDELYAPDNVDKYNGYNQAGLTAWKFYEEDFFDKIEDITYEYVVPTTEEHFTYEAFVNYMSELETPTQIGDRYNEIELWYSRDTLDNPKAGMLFTITAKFEELDSNILDECKEFFIDKLETLKDELKDLVTSEDYKGNLENIFLVNKGMINGDYGKTTAAIIFNYENGVSALEAEYKTAMTAYKTDALDQLLTMYNNYKEDNAELTDELETVYNKYYAILSSTEYSYIEAEVVKTKAWTEEIIDGILEDAEEDFENVLI